MTKIDFASLSIGDRVLKKGSGFAFAVERALGGRIIASRIMHIIHSQEWLRNGCEFESIAMLELGDIITSKASEFAEEYVVSSIHDSFAIAVKTIVIEISEAENWEVKLKANLAPPDKE